MGASFWRIEGTKEEKGEEKARENLEKRGEREKIKREKRKSGK